MLKRRNQIKDIIVSSFVGGILINYTSAGVPMFTEEVTGIDPDS